ncbi:MAG TPA: hypothetical protein EYQ69_06310 [Gemmatimonadetes bacterium]|nr:hypothetical protein [Gemmatimonadota bacterium]
MGHFRLRMEMVVRSGLVAFFLIGQCVPTSRLEGQELADYDYGNLAVRGISLDYGNISLETFEETESYSMKLDLGFLGPGIRMTTRTSYWSSQMLSEEIESFESSLSTLILTQGGSLPSNNLDLGPIRRDDFSLALEADYVWSIPLGFLFSTGLGASVHLVNGTTSIPDDVFLDGLLDSVTGGFNVQGGLEFLVNDRIRIHGGSRVGLVGNVRFLEFSGGMTFLWGELLSGEFR